MTISRREQYLLFFTISTVLLIEFLFQTRGIHFDENNYLRLALYNQIGDARNDGKQPLFYVLNYLLSNTVGALFGRGRYHAPYFAYLLLNAAGLAWLASRPRWDRLRRWLFVGILLASPLFLLNATQLMMESPLLALECLLVGALWPEAREPRALAATAICLLVLIKESTLPALAALVAAVWIWDRSRAIRLAKWTVIAVVLMKLLRLLTRVREQHYGGFLNFLHVTQWPQRLTMAGDYFLTWLFLVGPITVAAALYWWLRARRENDTRLLRGLFVLGALALPLTFFVELSVTIDFSRYLYPLLWLGALAWTLLAMQSLDRRWWGGLLAGSLIASAALWLPREPSFLGWPKFIANDLYFNDGTLLVGVPIHGWTLRAQAKFPKLCVLTSPVEHLRDYFQHAFPGTRLFDQSEAESFAKCDGAKVIALRGEIDPNHCRCDPRFSFAIESCVDQPVMIEGQLKTVRNLTCLP